VAIHLWHPGRVAKELASQTLSERDLIGTVLLSLITGYSVTTFPELNPVDHRAGHIVALAFALEVLMKMAGYLRVFKRFARTDGNFLDRAICLSLPCTIRTIVFGCALTVAFALGASVILNQLPIDWSECVYDYGWPLWPFLSIGMFNLLFFRQMLGAADDLANL
jgi:hypothetical protein